MITITDKQEQLEELCKANYFSDNLLKTFMIGAAFKVFVLENSFEIYELSIWHQYQLIEHEEKIFSRQ